MMLLLEATSLLGFLKNTVFKLYVSESSGISKAERVSLFMVGGIDRERERERIKVNLRFK